MIVLRLIGQRLALMLVVLMVLGFLGSDIIQASGWDWKCWFSFAQNKKNTGEIRSYVEFVTIEVDHLKVVTGIRYASSYTRHIEEQWCYAEFRVANPEQPDYRLRLASIEEGTKAPEILFSPGTLRPFALTSAEASVLISSHCHFKE